MCGREALWGLVFTAPSKEAAETQQRLGSGELGSVGVWVGMVEGVACWRGCEWCAASWQPHAYRSTAIHPHARTPPHRPL